uniref:Retroviral polymerase SH3-like domain-containing protein n=1 Tax=Chenopodium quinoa TaxID=63459 RepID=A0A803MBX5_CHEQI
MVVGLPIVDSIGFFEGCVYGKQSRNSFPVDKSWRASKCLELVHADLCGPMSVESSGGNISLYRRKLDKKSEKCIFIGYSPKSKAYRLYNPLSGKVIIRRDVQFNEEEFWNWNHDSIANTQTHILATDVFPPKPEATEFENSVLESQSLQSGGSSSSPSPSTPPTTNSSQRSSAASTPSSSSSESPPRKMRSLSEVYATCDFALYASDPTLYDEAAQMKQGPDGIFISQRKYATDLLKRFTMLNCKSVATPMNVNEKLVVHDGTGMANASFFRSIVGGLNYLSHTRPAITHSVSVISRFMHSPTQQHLGAAKRVLRYVAGTVNFGIWTKHIDICYHFIRDLVAANTIVLKHCGTNKQVADVFTKPLPQAKHDYFRLQMGVTNFEGRESVEIMLPLLWNPESATGRKHFQVKACGDLIWRNQFLREKNFKQTIPQVKVDDGEEITHETASTTVKRAARYLTALQAEDGHWPADTAFPQFYIPPLVSFSS